MWLKNTNLGYSENNTLQAKLRIDAVYLYYLIPPVIDIMYLRRWSINTYIGRSLAKGMLRSSIPVKSVNGGADNRLYQENYIAQHQTRTLTRQGFLLTDLLVYKRVISVYGVEGLFRVIV